MIECKDWDVEMGSIGDHKMRRNEVVKENIATLIVNKAILFSMFTPLMFTGKIFNNAKLLNFILH